MSSTGMSQRLAAVVWNVAIVTAILSFPAAMIWSGGVDAAGGNAVLMLGFAGAYLGGVGVLKLVPERSRLNRAATALSISALGLAVLYFAILLLPEPRYSRLLLIIGSALTVVGLVGPPALNPPPRVTSLAAGVVIAVAVGAAVLRTPMYQVRPSSAYSEVVATSHRTLVATQHTGLFQQNSSSGVRGGAIAPAPDGRGYLLVRARGDMYRFEWDEDDYFQIESLSMRAPINFAEFEADAPESVDRRGFRVADLLVRNEAAGPKVYVTHHYWYREDACFVVRVSSRLLPGPGNDVNEQTDSWNTVFESSPCLQFKIARGAPFAGVQIGGNLESLSDDELLLTVGDHQFDGWYGSPNYVQSEDADYGKTVVIDLSDSSASTAFTTGHRNAQGLAIDREGRIWSTEHGPEGGDELNLLRSGGDYGWPDHTYGTEYGSVVWPPGDSAAPAGSTGPAFAWVPSIGISEVISVNDPAFSAWRDDLLIASLVGRAVWRVRLDGERVVYTEPIDIGHRIRDVTGAGNGEFVLWTDGEAIIRLRPADELDHGAALFASRCGGCHDDHDHRIGPSLTGVAGGEVAARTGYHYTEALESFGGRWTDERLSAFIANPDSMVPGTAMKIDGVSDSAARRALVEYLKSLR